MHSRGQYFCFYSKNTTEDSDEEKNDVNFGATKCPYVRKRGEEIYLMTKEVERH